MPGLISINYLVLHLDENSLLFGKQMLGASCYLLNPFNELCVLETVSDNVCLIFFFFQEKTAIETIVTTGQDLTVLHKQGREIWKSCSLVTTWNRTPHLGISENFNHSANIQDPLDQVFPTRCAGFFFFCLPIIALALLVYCQQVWETGPPTSWIHRASVLFSINLLKLNAQRCLGNE